MAVPSPLGLRRVPPEVTSITAELELAYDSASPVAVVVPAFTDCKAGANSKSPLSLVRLGRVEDPPVVLMFWFALVTVTVLITALAAWYCPFPAWVAVMVVWK